MSSHQITHIPSLGPYELYPKGFDDTSPLFITDCYFVSHDSSQVGPHPKWPPDWFIVKCSEITAGLFQKSMEIHFQFQLDGIQSKGLGEYHKQL